jgi:hypothetical protein
VLNREEMGEAFLHHWSQFERSLPLLAQAISFVVSHTLPQVPLTSEDIRDRERPREITIELTSRRGVNEAAILGTLENLGIRSQVKHWFHGHSPVSAETNDGKYEESLDGLIVRLNNPRNYVFAYMPAGQDGRAFMAARDVFIKTPDEEDFHL